MANDTDRALLFMAQKQAEAEQKRIKEARDRNQAANGAAQYMYSTGSQPMPPPKDWQSLTDDEIIKIGMDTVSIEEGSQGGYFLPVTFARAVEEALKQKNSK